MITYESDYITTYRNGRWTKSELKVDKGVVEKIIGMSLVSMIGRSGRPEVIHITAYQNLLNNYEKLGALAGLKRRSVDAVLNMDIKVTAIEQNGVYTDKVRFSTNFRHWLRTPQGNTRTEARPGR